MDQSPHSRSDDPWHSYCTCVVIKPIGAALNADIFTWVLGFYRYLLHLQFWAVHDFQLCCFVCPSACSVLKPGFSPVTLTVSKVAPKVPQKLTKGRLSRIKDNIQIQHKLSKQALSRLCYSSEPQSLTPNTLSPRPGIMTRCHGGPGR